MTQQHIAELVDAGATLTLTKLAGTPETHPLAVARLWRKRGKPWSLFFVILWPENEFSCHVIDGISEPAKRQTTGDFLRDGQLLATIAPMDPDERTAFQWEKWKAQITPESIAWCEEQFQKRRR